MKFDISIIGLILGTLINMGLGALWYSPVLFMKPWMKEAGISENDIQSSQREMGKIYGMTGLGALITSAFLGLFVLNMNIDNIGEGLLWAVILWLGTQLPSIIKNWGFENRTWKLGMINHGYDLAVYLIVITIYVFLG